MTDNEDEIKLTGCERKTIYLAALGFEYHEIAKRLDMSQVMVKYYIDRVIEKTSAKNLTSAVFTLKQKELI